MGGGGNGPPLPQYGSVPANHYRFHRHSAHTWDLLLVLILSNKQATSHKANNIKVLMWAFTARSVHTLECRCIIYNFTTLKLALSTTTVNFMWGLDSCLHFASARFLLFFFFFFFFFFFILFSLKVWLYHHAHCSRV